MKRITNKFASAPDRLKSANDRASPAKRTANARGYNYAWQIERKAYLADHPLCVRCKSKGIVTAANTVDHVRPHHGDMILFWERSNWQSLCSHCHSSDKQKQEWKDRYGR